MKDTQGNIITEEEFTKDIGHGVLLPNMTTQNKTIKDKAREMFDIILYEADMSQKETEIISSKVNEVINTIIDLAIDNRNREVSQELLDMVEGHEDPKYCSIKIENLEALTSHKRD